MPIDKPAKVFADGAIWKRPREGAPDFVKGRLSIKVEDFTKFLKAHNNEGWVNLDLKKSQSGKLYLELDTWKKESTLTDDEKKTIKSLRDASKEGVSADEVRDEPPF